MIYDLIIVGGGAAGLFAAANVNLPEGRHGLILDQSEKIGRKLLMSGAGQCNITHAGDIKDFITHYGANGKKIRSILFSFNNQMLRDWLDKRGVETFCREDGKVFPTSLSGQHVLDTLVHHSTFNGFQIRTQRSVSKITFHDSLFHIQANSCMHMNIDSSHLPESTECQDKNNTFTARNILIACGGCSYPATGSDGSIFNAIAPLDLSVKTCTPALVPVSVENYPYSELSGVSVCNARVYIYPGNQRTKNTPLLTDDVLMTHRDFSGPGILNMSRWAAPGSTLEINWFPGPDFSSVYNDINNLRSSTKKQLITVLSDYFTEISLSHLRALCARAGADPGQRLSDTRSDVLKTLLKLVLSDRFIISGTAGFKAAMATKGGIDLSEIQTSTMQAIKYPGLYFAGEVLDVDGDTGGYNLQFAFSSAMKASESINKKL